MLTVYDIVTLEFYIQAYHLLICECACEDGTVEICYFYIYHCQCIDNCVGAGTGVSLSGTCLGRWPCP